MSPGLAGAGGQWGGAPGVTVIHNHGQEDGGRERRRHRQQLSPCPAAALAPAVLPDSMSGRDTPPPELEEAEVSAIAASAR